MQSFQKPTNCDRSRLNKKLFEIDYSSIERAQRRSTVSRGHAKERRPRPMLTVDDGAAAGIGNAAHVVFPAQSSLGWNKRESSSKIPAAVLPDLPSRPLHQTHDSAK